ncbi:hypothetical protein [Dolichospermum compactum]|uniref:DnaK-type molecular chaperone DnaK n=1 Tax=Dolichospermum compactum NIES-806 TaxID=1973481 RepID=A0A1Z4V545_9CYAN|nr:hypothetical protein [Dolichospermum compactum]BAZ86597.1 DnaK-type molecular chaperone DnaK [Dolichospermum compactum NIES-806]
MMYLMQVHTAILPITVSHTFKTVVEGQGLIHFQFFSPDDVKEDLYGVKNNERIGDILKTAKTWTFL